jgi:HlyD family secretion protein
VTFLTLIILGTGVGTGIYLLRGRLFQNSNRLAGTLEATKVDLSARLPAVISEVKVAEGERVHEGQKLIQLACDDFRIASDLANDNYHRTLSLYKSGSVSQEVMDQAFFKKEETDLKLKWCAVVSPIEGQVLNHYHEPGEWVNPGTKLLTVANIKKIWAYIYVSQTSVAQLSLGQPVIGYLPELGDQSFRGKIIKINEEAEFTPKNVQTRSERERLVFGVKISFEESNSKEILKPGMTVEVDFSPK